MRVTDSFRYRSVIQDLNRSRERLTLLQEQLATGKRINRPSDAPIDASLAMRFRTVLESNGQFDRTNNDAISFLSNTETSLEDINEIILSIRDIALQGANDTTSPRDNLADQLELTLESLLEVANTRFQGRYIFAGTETLNKPFLLDTATRNDSADGDIVTYLGNNEHYQRQLNENTAIDLNITGVEVFDARETGGVSVFQTIWDLRNILREETVNVTINKELDTLEAGVAETTLDVSSLQTIVAGLTNKIRSVKVTKDDIQASLSAFKTELDAASPDTAVLQGHIDDIRGFLASEKSTADKVRDNLDDIDTAYNNLLQNFLKVGTRTQLSFFNKDRFVRQNIGLRERLSQLEDTDFGEAFINFKAEENALNAALSAGARVISPSLLEFLGI